MVQIIITDINTVNALIFTRNQKIFLGACITLILYSLFDVNKAVGFNSFGLI